MCYGRFGLWLGYIFGIVEDMMMDNESMIYWNFVEGKIIVFCF